MRKGGSNWVEGDHCFDREIELEVLEERVRDRTHTLLRRLGETNEFETVFVDLESAKNAADAVTELSIRAKSVRGVWNQVKANFANLLKEVSIQIDELSVSELRVKLRAGIGAGIWVQKGDAISLDFSKTGGVTAKARISYQPSNNGSRAVELINDHQKV